MPPTPWLAPLTKGSSAGVTTHETLQPTGKELRIPSCDVVTVENSEITSHRFYCDQVEFLSTVRTEARTDHAFKSARRLMMKAVDTFDCEGTHGFILMR